MLREVGLNLIYLTTCVVCEEALGKHDKNILDVWWAYIDHCYLILCFGKTSRVMSTGRRQ